MTIVIDACVALAWCFEDEATSRTDAVLDQLAEDTAIVPALWELEVANVLLSAERRGRITESKTARFIALLGQLPISVEPEGDGILTLLPLGREHRLTAYDAAYLMLAEREGLPLATVDGKLRTAAKNAGVQLVIPDE